MKDKYLLDELESKIIDTVNTYMGRHFTEDSQYAILLSGGYDSGLLGALTKPFRGYRIRFPYGTLWDESRYAEAVSKHLNIPLTSITITGKEFGDNFTQAVRVMGEPTTHFSLVPLYILFKNLKDNGIEDVLSGEGPDEYLGGYARQIIFDELKKLSNISELRTYKGMITKALGFNNLVDQYGKMMGYPESSVMKYALLPDYPLQGLIGKMDMELGVIEKMEQKMASHFGIRIHYPYINSGFAEYCYKLPDDLKIRNGVTKWGFKQIADKYLPSIMKGRVKIGGPTAPVNLLMGWDTLDPFDKSKYIQAQKEVLGVS